MTQTTLLTRWTKELFEVLNFVDQYENFASQDQWVGAFVKFCHNVDFSTPRSVSALSTTTSVNCYTCTYSLRSSTTEVTPRTSTITIGHLCNSAFTIRLTAKLQHRQSSHLRRINDRRHTVSLTQLARQRGSLLPREQRGQTALLGCCAAQRWASMSAMNTQPDAQWPLPRSHIDASTKGGFRSSTFC